MNSFLMEGATCNILLIDGSGDFLEFSGIQLKSGYLSYKFYHQLFLVKCIKFKV